MLILQSRLNWLILLGLGINLNVVSAMFFQTRSFHKWLDILTGKSMNSGILLYLDTINQDIEKYSKKPEFAREIPEKLREISRVNLRKCNKTLPYKLQYDKKDSTFYDVQYVKFYAKLQYNLCLKDMELKRAIMAGDKIDKSKWAAWFNAFESDKNNEKTPTLQSIAEKLAIYLKRFVPRVESKNFKSKNEQVAMIENELKSIIKEVCPFVQRNLPLSENIDNQLMNYLDKNREEFHVDQLPPIWSKSLNICSDEREHVNLIGLVTHIFTTQLDSIEMKDEDLSRETSAKVLKDYLFLTHGDKPVAGATRFENPIEILKKYNTIVSDKNDKQIAETLLNLSKISSDTSACRVDKIQSRYELQQRYANSDYPILSGYVKSMNALQFHLCDMMIRFQISSLASNLQSVQLAQLEEFRYIFDTMKFKNRDVTGLVLDPRLGYAICVVEFLNRVMPRKGSYGRELKRARGITKTVDMLDVMNYESHKRESAEMNANVLQAVKSWHGDYMKQVCANVLKYLPINTLDQIHLLIKYRPGEKLGYVEERLFDYAILCKFSLRSDVPQDITFAL